MRNKIKILTMVMGCLIFLSEGIVEAGSATKTLQANIKIIQALQIIKSEEIEFGQIRSIGTNGTVTVDPGDDKRTASDPNLLGATSAKLHHRAEFTLAGDPGTPFDINLSATAASHDNGSNQELDITNLISFSKTKGLKTPQGLFDSNGDEKIYVGGTLQVPAGTTNGKYEGDITITISY